jgi:hypothetical protein
MKVLPAFSCLGSNRGPRKRQTYISSFLTHLIYAVLIVMSVPPTGGKNTPGGWLRKVWSAAVSIADGRKSQMNSLKIKAGLAVLAGAFVCGSAQAQSPKVWRGFANIALASPGCAAAGWSVGNTFTYVHRPRFVDTKNNLVDNGADTYLNLYNIHLGMGLKFTNRDIFGAGAVTVPVSFLSSRGGSGSYNVVVTAASTVPRFPQTTTQSVSIVLTIGNFSNVSDCTVTIEGSATRRP